MRIALSLAVLVLATAASPAILTSEPQLRLSDLRGAPAQASVCRDRIEQVRDERGLPQLDRGTASSDKALLIAAVDRRIDGCSVMVMRKDTTDVRPLPAAKSGPLLRKIPAR